MSRITEEKTATNSQPGYYYSSGTSSTVTDGLTDFVYQEYNPNSDATKLFHEYYNAAGKLIVGPTEIAQYPIAEYSDPNTTAIFDDTYSSFALGSGVHAVIYTKPTTSGYGPSDQTSVWMQELDDQGNVIQGPTELTLGGKGGIKDLYAISETSRADFGNTFLVGYSTFNPKTGAAAIDYSQFDDSGDLLASGTVAAFNDGTHHGIAFGSWYDSVNPQADGSPDVLLQYRTRGSSDGVVATLYDPNMNELVTRTILDHGPQGETPTDLQKFGAMRPGTTAAENYGVLFQTFAYQDSSGATHEEIALESVNTTTLQVQARTEFAVNNGNATGVGMEHLANGNFVAAYVDGTQTLVKEFNSSLQQIGATFTVPHDNNGFDDIVGLSGNSFEIFWRQSVSGSSLTTQHSAVFKV
jgi:hypothetical protein